MLLGAVNLFGQGSTTSEMNGKITDEKDQPIVGAYVSATHVPTGSKYLALTNSEGLFSFQGMKPGGPYTVEISFIGYAKETFTDIKLNLGESFVLNTSLKEGDVEVAEVTIIGTRGSAFKTAKTGASTNISNEEIKTIPSINRSISDMARLSPYANNMSFAGSDGRSTNFTIDGANFNNNFGLSSNLPGGGSPISLEAIDEIQVVITPFDVRQTNFIGGGINAITKSGTNTFKGSVYSFFTNQDMRGNKLGDYDFGDRADYSKTVYGVNFGGPIIKDKLFFFVNAEMEKKPGQVVFWQPSTDGVSDGATLSRTSIADMEAVKNHLIDRYGYDPGSFTDFPGDETNKKLLARIDWNINDKNKLNLRYNYTKNQAWNPTNGNSNDAGYRNRNMDRISQYSMAFANSLYSMDNIVNSFSAELNSRFSDKIHNQLLVTYTKIDDVRGSTSSKFPFIDILYGDAYPTVEPYISAGYELFTWNNGVHNKVITATDNFTYTVANHKFTAGLSFEYQMANNAYMRNGTGYYRYASVDDFLNDATPIDFALTYGYGGEENPAAEVAFNQYGFFAQDELNLNNFKLTYGFRADLIKYADNLIGNNSISALDFGGRSIDVGSWPDPKVLLSPRLGFSWDVKGDKSLQVRGGTGIFTGRLPLVFFTNMPTNSGMVQGSFAATTRYSTTDGSPIPGSNYAALSVFNGGMITDVNQMIDAMVPYGLAKTISPSEGALPRDINGVDPEFKMPQVWKTSVAVDYQLPVSFPLQVTVEGIFNKTINAVMLKNWDLMQPTASWERFSGSDNRYIYPADYEYNNRNAYVLSNTNEGWGAIGNITLKTTPVKNLNVMLAYTYTMSKEITGMPGSNAGSAYGGLLGIDGPHLPTLQTSQYVIPNRVIGSLSYSIPYAKDMMSTSISLFYSGTTFGYSYIYSNDMNGDGWGTDLIYIPSGRGDINFASQADEDAFFAFMDQDKYLKKHKGEYAGANDVRTPFVNNFDLRIAQNFKVKAGKTMNTLQFSLDILNFGNMLNSKWGTFKTMASANNGAILRYEGVNANNEPIYSMPQIEDAQGNDVYPTETFATRYFYTDLWSLQIGIRYIFN